MIMGKNFRPNGQNAIVDNFLTVWRIAMGIAATTILSELSYRWWGWRPHPTAHAWGITDLRPPLGNFLLIPIQKVPFSRRQSWGDGESWRGGEWLARGKRRWRIRISGCREDWRSLWRHKGVLKKKNVFFPTRGHVSSWCSTVTQGILERKREFKRPVVWQSFAALRGSPPPPGGAHGGHENGVKF